ncbi:prephenate dehydrogenase [soil metagenome]
MTRAPFERVAVLGPGLLGGSVALALRQRLPGVEVRLWGRRDEAVEEARGLGIGDFVGTDAREVVAGADLIVVATPVGVMAEVLESALAGGRWRDGTVVTDVGSVKQGVVDALTPVAREAGLAFVGSHPMAGSENAGLAHARGDLFAGAPCIVTPDPAGGAAAAAKVRTFWEILGAVVTEMNPEAHDAVVARLSHVPHLVASALAAMALGGDAGLARMAGGGFRDTTRVAAGDADLWTGILMENRAALAAPLGELISGLQTVAEHLDRGDAQSLWRFLDHARKLRHSCPPPVPSK